MSAAPSAWNICALADARKIAVGNRLHRDLLSRDQFAEAGVVRRGLEALHEDLATARQYVAEDCAPWFEVQR